MNNNVNLTNNELSLVITSLWTTIESFKEYEKKHGVLSSENETILKEFKELYNRIESEYF